MTQNPNGKEVYKSALLVSLLNVVLPNPAIFVVDRLKIDNKSFSALYIQFTASQILFKRRYVDYQRIVAIFVKSYQEVQVHCRESDRFERQVMEIRSNIVSQLYNELFYRVSVCQTWTRRLRSGIVKEALLDREMLILLNKSSPLFGYLTPTQISEITDRIRKNGYFFSNSISYKTVNMASAQHFSFFDDHMLVYAPRRRYACVDGSSGLFYPSPACQSPAAPAQQNSLLNRSNLTLDECSDFSTSTLSTVSQYNVLSPMYQQQSTIASNIADSIISMSHKRQKDQFSDVLHQRRYLEFLTGTCEPMRVKIAVDQIQLNKYFRQIYNVQDVFLRYKFENSLEACRLLKILLQGLYAAVLTTNSLERRIQADSDNFLQSASVADIAEIAVERMACSLIFPRLWTCVKAEYTSADAHFLTCCEKMTGLGFLRRRGLDVQAYDALQQFLGIPKELRDFCGFNLVISEIKQLDSALNMHPRNFTRILLEANAALQLTINLNTEKGRGHRLSKHELVTIGQDEQLPIMIFVIASAQLKNAITILKIMENASFDSILQDEEGFMVNQFACCIQWVVDEVSGRHDAAADTDTPTGAANGLQSECQYSAGNQQLEQQAENYLSEQQKAGSQPSEQYTWNQLSKQQKAGNQPSEQQAGSQQSENQAGNQLSEKQAWKTDQHQLAQAKDNATPHVHFADEPESLRVETLEDIKLAEEAFFGAEAEEKAEDEDEDEENSSASAITKPQAAQAAQNSEL